MTEKVEAELDSLMGRLAQGDRAAFDPLFPELQKRAQRVAHTRLDQATADDVVQSALLKVFARAHEFTPGRSALAWFYAIVANEVRGAQRAQRKHDPIDHHDHHLVSPARTPDELLLERELEHALRAAIVELDPASAQAIHAMLGYGPPLILPSATFRKRLSRAYARLRVLLGELP